MSDPTEYLTTEQERMADEDQEIRDEVRREEGTLHKYRALIVGPIMDKLNTGHIDDQVILYLKRMGPEVADALNSYWQSYSEPPDPLEADEKFRAAVEIEANRAVAAAHCDQGRA